MAAMPPASRDIETGSGTTVGSPAKAGALIASNAKAALANSAMFFIRGYPLLLETYYDLRFIRLTAAMAAMPPAKSESDTGSGTCCDGPAKAGALAIIVPSTTAIMVAKSLTRIFLSTVSRRIVTQLPAMDASHRSDGRHAAHQERKSDRLRELR